jgi:hypothetical protein
VAMLANTYVEDNIFEDRCWKSCNVLKFGGRSRDALYGLSSARIIGCLRIRKFPRFTPGSGYLAPGFGKYPKYISRFRRDWEIN